MGAKVNSNLSFAGRLAAYKVWGDSSGVKFNQGSLGDVTMDGNTSSLPHGDTIRMERAYFMYRQDVKDIPVSFSLGRRPSTNGPPLEYGDYGMVGGSPLSTIINWQFEGDWGSQYWFNFTGAEDSLVGSKLATRGSVYEGYYIQPIFGKHFFVKLGGRFYDYEYTGSGSPLGEPEKISQANSFDGLFPIVDEVWDVYASATMRF
jgi:hypothetical protein